MKGVLTHNFIVIIGTDCTGSCKSNYQMIMTMRVPSTVLIQPCMILTCVQTRTYQLTLNLLHIHVLVHYHPSYKAIHVLVHYYPSYKAIHVLVHYYPSYKAILLEMKKVAFEEKWPLLRGPIW